MNNTAVHK